MTLLRQRGQKAGSDCQGCFKERTPNRGVEDEVLWSGLQTSYRSRESKLVVLEAARCLETPTNLAVQDSLRKLSYRT